MCEVLAPLGTRAFGAELASVGDLPYVDASEVYRGSGWSGTVRFGHRLKECLPRSVVTAFGA